jgi:3',5'-cyclic AMP phosphodiesterase CpdA
MDATGTTRIAHLSDAHVLDPRPSRTRAGWSMQVRFLSFGRPLDAIGRRKKLLQSLDTARRVGADHFVLSGDLTEIGTPGEFETLAEILHDSAIPADKFTLVPGNHDVYTSADGWRWALAGPLAPFARNASDKPGKIVEVGGANLVPVDATFHQPVTRSAGVMNEADASAIEKFAADPHLAKRPLVIVQHHPPFVRSTNALHWLDGLVGASRLMHALETFKHLFVVHGHLHTIVNRAIGTGVARVLGATAVVEDRDDSPRVRLYDVRDGELHSAGLAS